MIFWIICHIILSAKCEWCYSEQFTSNKFDDIGVTLKKWFPEKQSNIKREQIFIPERKFPQTVLQVNTLNEKGVGSLSSVEVNNKPRKCKKVVHFTQKKENEFFNKHYLKHRIMSSFKKKHKRDPHYFKLSHCADKFKELNLFGKSTNYDDENIKANSRKSVFRQKLLECEVRSKTHPKKYLKIQESSPSSEICDTIEKPLFLVKPNKASDEQNNFNLSVKQPKKYAQMAMKLNDIEFSTMIGCYLHQENEIIQNNQEPFTKEIVLHNNVTSNNKERKHRSKEIKTRHTINQQRCNTVYGFLQQINEANKNKDSVGEMNGIDYREQCKVKDRYNQTESGIDQYIHDCKISCRDRVREGRTNIRGKIDRMMEKDKYDHKIGGRNPVRGNDDFIVGDSDRVDDGDREYARRDDARVRDPAKNYGIRVRHPAKGDDIRVRDIDRNINDNISHSIYAHKRRDRHKYSDRYRERNKNKEKDSCKEMEPERLAKKQKFEKYQHNKIFKKRDYKLENYKDYKNFKKNCKLDEFTNSYSDNYNAITLEPRIKVKRIGRTAATRIRPTNGKAVTTRPSNHQIRQYQTLANSIQSKDTIYNTPHCTPQMFDTTQCYAAKCDKTCFNPCLKDSTDFDMSNINRTFVTTYNSTEPKTLTFNSGILEKNEEYLNICLIDFKNANTENYNQSTKTVSGVSKEDDREYSPTTFSPSNNTSCTSAIPDATPCIYNQTTVSEKPLNHTKFSYGGELHVKLKLPDVTSALPQN